MVSQPWKEKRSKHGLLEQRRKHCALCWADKEMTIILSMSCGDSGWLTFLFQIIPYHLCCHSG
jgi:hypothetical protein